MRRTDADYQRDLEIGLAFENTVYRAFSTVYPIVRFHPSHSSYRQITVGENEERYEIKKDQKFRTTGNLFIEVRERSPARSWHPAGIHDATRPQCLVIGNEETFWIFDAGLLREQMPLDAGVARWPRRTTETSDGYLLSVRAIPHEKACLVRYELGARWITRHTPAGQALSVHRIPDARGMTISRRAR